MLVENDNQFQRRKQLPRQFPQFPVTHAIFTAGESLTIMKTKSVALCAILLSWSAAGARAADYAVGADLSFLKQNEDRGIVFKDNGETKPGLQIFKDHGYNWIRLRLFH